MDSFFSFGAPKNEDGIAPPPPSPPPQPPAQDSHSQTALLVPKPEPFWASSHDDDIADNLDIVTEFHRVTQLFHHAFGNTNVVLHPTAVEPEPGALAFFDSPPSANVTSAVLPDPSSSSSVSDASRAIVPVADGTVKVVSRRKHSRQKELVRAVGMSAREEAHQREEMRRTRLIYDSLRVLTAVEEEMRVAKVAAAMEAAAAGTDIAESSSAAAEREAAKAVDGRGRRLRGDLRAAALMRERGLWLNREHRIIGPIPGIFVGDLFLFRMELCVVGLHGQIQAGIDYLPGSMSPSGEPIATSVIVSGGYEDDLDNGEIIVYTGHGGQEKNSSKQIADQKLESGNLALERSMHYGIEVRVIRGMRYEGSASASGKVYVYDGVYKILHYWFDVGRSGFGVYKFQLWRVEGQAKMGSAILKEARNIRRSESDFHTRHCVSPDLSNEKENVAVRLFNDIDDGRDPLNYDYLAKTIFPQFVFHLSGQATGCDCVDACVAGCFCAGKNGGEFPYTLQGLPFHKKPLIFECGPFCSCPPHCRNRVTQKGLKYRLEVFRSLQTAWGVRSLDLIQAGTFICEFAGVVLTREQAQLFAMNGDLSIYPNRFVERWAEWGDLSRVYPTYVRPSYPSIPPLDFSLDVSTMRNVACYISHSPTPNVLVQFVLYDHNNLMFPHLMLFAMENIPPMRELSLDYGVANEWTGKLSICN